jgi:membrane-bound serine protease (ClpP class)
VVITIIAGIGLLFVFGKNIFASKLFEQMVLQDAQRADEGYISVDMKLKHLIGSEAMTVTDLKPSGKIEINGERHDAYAEGLWISAGTRVRIVRLNGNTLVVSKVDD